MKLLSEINMAWSVDAVNDSVIEFRLDLKALEDNLIIVQELSMARKNIVW
jgi:hypothetical protein